MVSRKVTQDKMKNDFVNKYNIINSDIMHKDKTLMFLHTTKPLVVMSSYSNQMLAKVAWRLFPDVSS